ncbi:MAG TPA: NAD-dependent epimerase/dehydratase family protein [Anaeromyxobacteraceae bacterium]|nr:NAD-dependent epimerase/dehydratase family protein [Anaeromyxobacteraceae bacterium]
MSLTRRDFLGTSLSALALACAGPGPGGGARAAGRKRILILGGTSFLGPAIVEAARPRGHLLTLFNRGRTNPGLFPEVEQVHGDRDGGLDALRGRAWDAAIDTSGYVPRLVRASAELLAPAVGRYLFVSTISVYADGIPPGSDEGAPLATVPDPSGEDVRAHYGGLKALCERAVEAALPGRTAVVRPGLIVGPRDPTDRFTYWPVRLARGGEVLAPGDGKDPVQIVDVRDLAAWMVELVERGVTGTFNAAGPARTLTMGEMLAACGEAAGGAAQLTWVPAPFLEKEGVAPWSDMPVWVPAGPDAGFAQVSNARAVAAGLRFRPAAETARDTLAWWRTLPEERRAKLRAGLAPEREIEVLARWRAKRGG